MRAQSVAPGKYRMGALYSQPEAGKQQIPPRAGASSLKVRRLHTWNVTAAEARRIQSELRSQVELCDRLGPVRLIAGADVAFDQYGRPEIRFSLNPEGATTFADYTRNNDGK